jgi:hypothetical protein
VRHPRQYAIDTFHPILLFQLHEEKGPAAFGRGTSHVRRPFYIGGVGIAKGTVVLFSSGSWLLAKVKIPTSRKRRETWGTLLLLAKAKAGSSPALSRWFGMTGVWGEVYRGLPRKTQINSMIRITTTINSSTKARLWLNWSTMKRYRSSAVWSFSWTKSL